MTGKIDDGQGNAPPLLVQATGIFIVGDQGRLTVRLAGTRGIDGIRERHAQGVTITAGASILAEAEATA